MSDNPKEGKVAADRASRVAQYVRAAEQVHARNQYKGLRIHALPGLHERAAEILLGQLEPGASILDLAAGSGAMARRLSDHGFAVTACDRVDTNFRLHDSVPFFKVNLDESFSEILPARYDAVVALKIIEHLENPRNFLRQCRVLLKSDGVLLLSTPNIDNPVSQALSVVAGHYMWFSDAEYRHEGHIAPISQWYLEKCAVEAGLECRLRTSVGDPFRRYRRWWRVRLLARILQAFWKNRDRPAGEVLVACFAPAGHGS